MRRYLVCFRFGLACAATVSVSCTTGLRVESPTETAILSAEAERRTAYTRLDSAAVGRLLADDYLAPSSEHGGGIHTRADGLRAVVEHATAVDPYPIDSIRTDSTKVRIYGNVGIVTGIESITVTYTNHTPPETRVVRLLYANVWALRQGRLQLVNQQRTLLE